MSKELDNKLLGKVMLDNDMRAYLIDRLQKADEYEELEMAYEPILEVYTKDRTKGLREENQQLREINTEWIERCNTLIKGIKALGIKETILGITVEKFGEKATDDEYKAIKSALDIASKGVYPTRKKGVMENEQV